MRSIVSMNPLIACIFAVLPSRSEWYLKAIFQYAALTVAWTFSASARALGADRAPSV